MDADRSNLNKNGESVSIIGCESSRDVYRFDFVGVFEAYMNDRSNLYSLSGGIKSHESPVYVYTSMEYFDHIYSFTIPKELTLEALNKQPLKFCAQEIGQQKQKCQAFVGNNFSEVIESLCLP